MYGLWVFPWKGFQLMHLKTDWGKTSNRVSTSHMKESSHHWAPSLKLLQYFDKEWSHGNSAQRNKLIENAWNTETHGKGCLVVFHTSHATPKGYHHDLSTVSEGTPRELDQRFAILTPQASLYCYSHLRSTNATKANEIHENKNKINPALQPNSNNGYEYANCWFCECPALLESGGFRLSCWTVIPVSACRTSVCIWFPLLTQFGVIGFHFGKLFFELCLPVLGQRVSDCHLVYWGVISHPAFKL